MDQGLALLRKGAYADAIECFDLSMKFDEDNPNVYAAKGFALANTVKTLLRRKI
jgi:Flp pilus assembly protein TadD